MEKKTEVITFRTDESTLDKIKKMAKEKEWTTAKTVDKICKEYFKLMGENAEKSESES